uniref:Uncharacterized protein n=1 Tax=Romanomermis culicivorax TaxID=13658 RepID=A0A915JM65_ROMCU
MLVEYAHERVYSEVSDSRVNDFQLGDYQDERLEHAELYNNYTEDCGYLNDQLYCIMSKKTKN